MRLTRPQQLPSTVKLGRNASNQVSIRHRKSICRIDGTTEIEAVSQVVPRDTPSLARRSRKQQDKEFRRARSAIPPIIGSSEKNQKTRP